jgi:hypothetical protein
MKRILIHLFAALLAAMAAMVALTAGGCGTVRHESAMEWMQKQPNYIDP